MSNSVWRWLVEMQEIRLISGSRYIYRLTPAELPSRIKDATLCIFTQQAPILQLYIQTNRQSNSEELRYCSKA